MDYPKTGLPNIEEKKARTESHMNPITNAPLALASESDDSNNSVTEKIDLTTSRSKYVTITPIVFNAGGTTSTNHSSDQTRDNYRDTEIDEIDDVDGRDYVPPEESEGSSDDSQDDEETDNMLITSQKVEDLQNEGNHLMIFARYLQESPVVVHSSSSDEGNNTDSLQ